MVAPKTLTRRRTCAVVGAGPGNGAAFGRCFASEGYDVALMARDVARLRELARTIPGSSAFECNVMDERSVEGAFSAIANDLGPVDVLVYNAGNFVPGAVDTDLRVVEECFRVNVLGCLASVQRVVPAMRESGGGAIVVVGATASLRGAAHALPFAAAKAGQRAMAQSLARQLGPEGIHVAYVVVDAVIDTPWTRTFFSDRPDEFFARPDDVASVVLHLTQQPRSAWSFELDLRPHVEKW